MNSTVAMIIEGAHGLCYVNKSTKEAIESFELFARFSIIRQDRFFTFSFIIMTHGEKATIKSLPWRNNSDFAFPANYRGRFSRIRWRRRPAWDLTNWASRLKKERWRKTKA